MLKSYSDKEKSLIVKNVIAACRDITKLNKRGYNYLNLCNGFIAHYNINGFKAHYTDESLKSKIVENYRFNQWHNFRESDIDYDYYMSKKEVYNAICESLKTL